MKKTSIWRETEGRTNTGIGRADVDAADGDDEVGCETPLHCASDDDDGDRWSYCASVPSPANADIEAP